MLEKDYECPFTELPTLPDFAEDSRIWRQSSVIPQAVKISRIPNLLMKK